VEKYREVIQDQMRKQGITGFAIALVTDEDILWTEGFGCTDRTCQTLVSEDTPFGIQSMSKSMTVTAVLLAVQEGILDLDEPISTYLPEFSVHSIFDENPQDLITLRMLLSHTAGFTEEAPVGNNNELDPGTWEEHIASISDTWLIYPVGQMYAYSNPGIDLAGYILEQQAGMPFQVFLKTRLFEPLGMDNSTFDRDEILQQTNRAIGQSGMYHQIPPITPMMPAGGAFASANDLAHYVQFHINQGSFKGQPILASELIAEMYKPHFQASQAKYHGLGLYFNQGRDNTKTLRHNGGGFGFMSQMLWYPDLKIGIAWVSNSQENEHDLFGWLSYDILNAVIDTMPEVYAARASENDSTIPAAPSSPALLAESDLYDKIRQAALEPDEQHQQRWKEYAGTYGFKKWGQTIFTVRVQAGETLVINGYPVAEVEPGLFFFFGGEAIDFRGEILTVGNNKLERDNGLLLAQTILLRVCGAGFLLAIVWNVAELGRWMLQRRKGQENASGQFHWLDGFTRSAITLGSLLGVATLYLLFKFPVFIFSGTPLPHGGLHADMRLGFGMVYAVVVLALLSVIGLVLSWRSRVGSRLNRILSSLFIGLLILYSLLVIV
jgi:CubicO group peptidase (beta-lactamase class C family)